MISCCELTGGKPTFPQGKFTTQSQFPSEPDGALKGNEIFRSGSNIEPSIIHIW